MSATHGYANDLSQKRGSGARLGVMLVEEGGADGEVGGGSPSSSAKLQLVRALRRGKCSGASAATGWEGRIDGARGRLGRIRLSGDWMERGWVVYCVTNSFPIQTMIC
eukprot:COSAG02_NODE_8106_length_2707_cov_29.223806_1_plen_108_part_00